MRPGFVAFSGQLPQRQLPRPPQRCPSCEMSFDDQLQASAALGVMRRLAIEIHRDPGAKNLIRSLEGIRNIGPVGEALAEVLAQAGRMGP